MRSPDSEHHSQETGAANQDPPNDPSRELGLRLPLGISYPEIFRSETLQQFEDVPMITMLNSEFCGYASLAMLLQFHGLNFDQFDVFRRVHDTDMDPKKVAKHQLPAAPSFYRLAAAAAKIVKGTDLRVDLWREEEHEKRQRAHPESTPLSVLDMYLTHFKVPTMVRIPGHNMVAVGIDERSPAIPGTPKIYLFNDPNGGRRRVEKADRFSILWSDREPREDLAGRPIAIDRLHPGNTANLLLAIRRK